MAGSFRARSHPVRRLVTGDRSVLLSLHLHPSSASGRASTSIRSAQTETRDPEGRPLRRGRGRTGGGREGRAVDRPDDARRIHRPARYPFSFPVLLSNAAPRRVARPPGPQVDGTEEVSTEGAGVRTSAGLHLILPVLDGVETRSIQPHLFPWNSGAPVEREVRSSRSQ